MKNEVKLKMTECFSEVVLTETYEPYFCSVEEAITIVIIGIFCGLCNLKQIHQWADHDKIKEILAEHFGVSHVPCYYRMTCLLKILDPQSMRECFARWVVSLLLKNMD